MKKISFTLAALLAGGMAFASPLTPGQAIERLVTAEGGMRLMSTNRFTASDLSYTVKAGGEAAVYVFSRPGAGYVITSADDIAEPLLAYSDESVFNAASMPDAMRWWLDEYRREIEQARKSGVRRMMNAPQRPQRDPIAPLCATKWNQASPYNLLCPQVNGRYTYSGCVATAMAQVMKYHNWPETGKGSKSYQWNGQTLSVNFGEQTYDWANMTNTYGASSTDAQNNAVAELMYACGVSVSMNYGLNGSGAQSSAVPKAMMNYFRYGRSLTYAGRDYVPLLRWESMIYESLRNNAPVYYSGQNLTVGHAFVCDGYSTDGYFHFNWGWGGMSDGYFRLTALDPGSQGIGGSNDGYNIYQSAILMARPENTDNTPMVVMMSEQQVIASYDSASATMSLAGQFRSQSSGTTTMRLGLRVNNVQSGASVIYPAAGNVTLGSRGVVKSIDVSMPYPAQGLYTVTPMVNSTPDQAEATWDEMLMPLGEPTVAYMQVDEDGIEFTYPEYELMSADGLQLKTPLYVGRDFKLALNVHNELPSEVYEFFLVGLIRDNKIYGMSDPYSVDLFAGDSQQIEFVGNFGGVDPGDYQLGIIQLVGNGAYLISEPMAVTVQAAPSTNSFAVTGLKLENQDAVDCSDMHFSFNLKVNEGYFSYPVFAYVFPSSGGGAVAQQGYETMFLNAGESVSPNYTMSVPGLTIGNSYMLGIYANNQPLSRITFVVGTDAVEAIEGADGWSLSQEEGMAMLTAPENLTSVVVYNMAGMVQNATVDADGSRAEVNISGLAPGIYLLRATTAKSARTMKLVRR